MVVIGGKKIKSSESACNSCMILKTSVGRAEIGMKDELSRNQIGTKGRCNSLIVFTTFWMTRYLGHFYFPQSCGGTPREGEVETGSISGKQTDINVHWKSTLGQPLYLWTIKVHLLCCPVFKPPAKLYSYSKNVPKYTDYLKPTYLRYSLSGCNGDVKRILTNPSSSHDNRCSVRSGVAVNFIGIPGAQNVKRLEVQPQTANV